VRSGRLSKGLTGKVSLKCKDGRPLLAFLGDALPKWTRWLIDLEGLSAAADVVLSQPRTAIHELEASGGNFVVSGEYDRRGERVRGAFLIETGILIVGVELDEDGSRVRPLLARQWFRKTRSEGLVHAPPGESSGGAGAAKSEE
jgi:hypothetical protein